MKKCPVDISKVRHSESAEQNVFISREQRELVLYAEAGKRQL
jgi:hypothetical protein